MDTISEPQTQATAAGQPFQNVTVLEASGRRIVLVGTAHVSRESAELVEQVIREERPETVCVELDLARLEALTNPDRWRNTDLFQVIRSGKSHLLLTQLVLASFQRKLADQLGVKPGAEMLRGVTVAADIGAKLECVDREIKITLKRAWSGAGLWSVTKLVTAMCLSIFDSAHVEEKDIEALKETDALSAMMGEFGEVLPDVKRVLIDERDEYMAQKIFASGGRSVVAVLGAGHVPGITRIIREQFNGKPIDITPLESLPPARLSSKLIGWSIPALVLALIVWGFFAGGAEQSREMLYSWVLITGGCGAIGALLALPHPLTVVTAFVASPLTTLHPMLAAGWFCGLVEVFLRKPRVADLETIASDVSTARGWWKNRVSRILLVVMFSNLGAAAGAVVGVGMLAKVLGSGQ